MAQVTMDHLRTIKRMVEESLSLKTINKKYKEHGSKTSCKEKSSAKNKTIHFKGSIKTI